MIGWKPQYDDPRVASVRLRCLNPLAELKQRGFPIELFGSNNISKYSAVIFSKSYDAESYEMASELKRQRTPVIFDICDNHFYNPYNLEKFNLVRIRLLQMLDVADLVVTSTDTLAKVLCCEGKLKSAPIVIGDPLESEDFLFPKNWLQTFVERFRRDNSSIRKANVLWYGIHGGENAPYGMLDILKIQQILLTVNRDYPLRIIVVSNSRAKYRKYIQKLPIESKYYEWGYTPFRQILQQCHINIIPITRNPFTLCKSNNRLARALYEGVPTVADEIPSYRPLEPFCVLNNWEDGLQLYLHNREIVREHVTRAKAFIEDHFTIRYIADQWQACLSRFV